MKSHYLWRIAVSAITLPAALAADEQANEHSHERLETVTVTASPLATNELEMTQSAEVLNGEALERAVANSIGETVSDLPGVHSSGFGPAVGRPVIRGLAGARIDVLENNVSSNDASNVSADHAVSIEPFLAEQIEVLRGPATLLYGSNTIGGVVNVRTNRIPQSLVSGSTGGFQLQGDSVSNERFGVFKLDAGNDEFTIHIDAFGRDTDDFDIPGFAENDPEREEHHDEDGEEHEDEEEVFGVLENSALESRGGAAGASFFGDNWRAGLSWSTYETKYGIPGAHHHEEEGEEHEEEGHEEELVSIDMDSARLDGELVLDNPFNGFESLKFLVSNSDYEHVELEGDEIGTQFFNDTTESRVEFVHNRIGKWRGAFGLQYGNRDFEAIGAEAFVPPTQTKTVAFFILEEAELNNWRVELGARFEDQQIDVADGRNVSHDPFSLSAGAVYHVNENAHFNFNLARAERAPAEEELFASGPHLATQTFEIGNPNLSEETSTNFEIGFSQHFGQVTGSIALFRNDFSDFILLQDTGLVEDELPVRVWAQQDADFQGLEAELRWDSGDTDFGHFQLRLHGDTVDAELSDGSNVPRTPPTRFGIGTDWEYGNWSANLDWTHNSSQNDVAEGETPTASFDMIDLDMVYRLPQQGRMDWEVYIKGRNLTDEDARLHTSFLKDVAPLPGRNFVLGLRGLF